MTATEDRRRSDIMQLVRADLRTMGRYQAADPIEVVAARYGIAPDKIIKLDANENLFGPGPRTRAALNAPLPYHLYADPGQPEVRQALGEYVGVPPEHIVAGTGSDEIIDLLARALLEPGDRVIDLVPTFGMYSFETAMYSGEYVPVERTADFAVDVAAVEAAVDARTKLIFITTPNNPSGNVIGREELERILALGVPTIVDEAYIEFSGGSIAHLVPERDNLIVMRTFSKWAALAGVRAGYGIMPVPLADLLMKIKQPFNLSVSAVAAMLAALEEKDLLMERVATIVQEREKLIAGMARIPFLRPWPSQANFILVDVTRGDVPTLRDGLRRHGIFIRYYDRPGLTDKFRISVGRPEHTDFVLTVLREMGDEPRA